MQGLQMVAIKNQHVCYILFSDAFRSGIHTKQSIEHPHLIISNQVFVATL